MRHFPKYVVPLFALILMAAPAYAQTSNIDLVQVNSEPQKIVHLPDSFFNSAYASGVERKAPIFRYTGVFLRSIDGLALYIQEGRALNQPHLRLMNIARPISPRLPVRGVVISKHIYNH
jgi:hypothetical protein